MYFVMRLFMRQTNKSWDIETVYVPGLDILQHSLGPRVQQTPWFMSTRTQSSISPIYPAEYFSLSFT